MSASWQQAIDGTPNGQIFATGDTNSPLTQMGLEGLTGAAEMFYQQSVAQHNEDNPTNQLAGFQLTQTGITDGVFISDEPFANGQGPQEHESLVMSWDSAGDDMLSIGAWEYVYDVDPDLSNKMIHFSILAPPGIWDLSLELISVDAQGVVGSAGWFLSMPPNTWTNYWINTNLGAQQGFQYFQTPTFNIQNVVAIRLDEAGNSVTFPANPTGGPFYWNAWNHLQVTNIVPEPATALLGGLGLMALSAATRRRRA